MTLFVLVTLGVLSIAAIGLKRAYESVSIKELKKRSQKGDEVATLLHRSVSYGPSLQLILWLVVVLTNASFFVYASRSTETWFAILLCSALLWVSFIWLPKRQVGSFGIWMAAKISPAISYIASFMHPLVRTVHSYIKKMFPVHVHTGLYDEQDLQALLQKQANQKDNQISQSALEIAHHALTYAKVPISEILVPRRAVKMVQEDETTGPVFIDEH